MSENPFYIYLTLSFKLHFRRFSFGESRFSLFCLHLSAQSRFSYNILPYPHTCASQLPAEVPPAACLPCPARSLPLRYSRHSLLSDTLTASCVPPACPDRSAHTISMLLPSLKAQALAQGGIFNLPTLGVMYVFGFDLFFDFAGYSMFALAASNLMGIKSPINFDKPFISRDLKEFWNRWHMSLSFWFRDFVFMRLVMVLMRNKVFKNRNTTSNVAYVINMMVMGFWHGVTWYYIAYGIFHGIGLGINDAWLRKKKTINKERKKAGLEPLPENKWTKALGIFITFNTVMLSFLIFSGFLNDLWFTKK